MTLQYVWDKCEEHATSWNQMLQNRQLTIVTIHNYGKSCEVGGSVSFQHVGGDWWRKRRVVKLYKNFYAKSSFINQAPVASIIIAWFQKTSIPHQRGNWKFRRGQRTRKFQRGGCLDGWFSFEGTFNAIRIQVSIQLFKSPFLPTELIFHMKK